MSGESYDYEVKDLLEHQKRVMSIHCQQPLTEECVGLVVELGLVQVEGLQVGSGPTGFQLADHLNR